MLGDSGVERYRLGLVWVQCRVGCRVNLDC